MKNLLRIITFCLTTASIGTQCMVVQALKKTISVAGTTLGLGLPLSECINSLIVCISNKNRLQSDPVKHIEFEINCKTRTPNNIEAPFIQSCLKKNTPQCRIIPQHPMQKSNGTTNGKIIAITEKSKFLQYKLSDAIKYNDTESLRTYAAILQHEEGHVIHNHQQKTYAFSIAAPLLITCSTAYGFKKFFPVNRQSSLAKHCGRFLTKTMIGIPLIAALYAYAKKKFNHMREFQADQNIKPENRNAFINYLKKADSQNKKFLDTLEPVEKMPKSFELSFLHPSVEERIKRLSETTKNV